PELTLRGYVSRDSANVFEVRCSAADKLPHHSTWRHCVMWRIALPGLRALPETSTEEDIWQAGKLHTLGQATCTPSKPELAPRSKRLATSFGDTLALALDDQGPAIAAFKTLLSSGTQSGGDLPTAVLQFDRPANIDIDPPRNTLKLFTTGVVEFDLPKPVQI
ncbi:MAG: hypothetical protein ACKPKO_52880, partial [Candidatus Fonsibacter sp.]